MIFLGPKYSKFKDFSLSIKGAKEFLLNVLKYGKQYIGHNPATSFVMITIIFIIPFIIFTGALGSDNNLN